MQNITWCQKSQFIFAFIDRMEIAPPAGYYEVEQYNVTKRYAKDRLCGVNLNEVNGLHFIDRLTCSLIGLVENSVDFICMIDYTGFLEAEKSAQSSCSIFRDVLLSVEEAYNFGRTMPGRVNFALIDQLTVNTEFKGKPGVVETTVGTTDSRTKIAIVAVSNGSIPIQQQARQNIHDFEVQYSKTNFIPNIDFIRMKEQLDKYLEYHTPPEVTEESDDVFRLVTAIIATAKNVCRARDPRDLYVKKLQAKPEKEALNREFQHLPKHLKGPVLVEEEKFRKQDNDEIYM